MSDDVQDSVRSISERLLRLQAQAGVAAAHDDRGELRQALASVSSCLAEALTLGEPGSIGLALQIKARVNLSAGDAAGAVDDCIRGETALVDPASAPAALASHPRLDQVLELRKIRIEALAAQGDSAGLARLAQDTIRVLEVRRARLHDPFQRAAFLAGRTVFYEMFAFGSFKLERWDDLLSSVDLLKSRASYLAPAASMPAAEDPQISARLAAANASLARSQPGSPPYAAAAEQRRLLMSLRAIVQHADADPDSPDEAPGVTVAAVQAALQPGEALVAWVWITHEVLIVLAIDAARFHAERIVLSGGARSALDAYVRALRAQTLDPATLDASVECLGSVLLPPAVGDFVARCRRLIVSPHRELHVVPLHAARLGGRRLIERCSVRYVPTLGCVLRPRRPVTQQGGLFALGIDVFNVRGERWPVLKQAEAEVAEVAAVWRNRSLPVMTMTGPAATSSAFKALGSRLARYFCLHIATHGASVFDREAKNDPMAARLILQDGALDALAVSQLRLSAEVVVLSACNSGQRALEGRGLEEFPGDDNFGLQAAFFEAGARNVIGALWPVVDEVAPVLMKTLHASLAAGSPVDLAWQAAVVDYLGRPDARSETFAWGQMFLSSLN